MSRPNAITFLYVRWKALLFGALPLALGIGMVWIGIEAFDPAWTAQVTRGQALADAPFWIRAPVMLAVGIIVLGAGFWPLMSTAFQIPVVVADDQQIASRTLFGRPRRLRWADIVAAKRKKNQLVLSPAGINTIGQEIWDRKSVNLDVGLLAAAPGEVEALVLLHRPDLVFQDVK